MSMNTALLQVTDLRCVRHQLLFSNLSFRLHAGEMLLVTGPNGSGKSSLLRLLAGLSSPTDGDIQWNNNSISHCTEDYANAMHFIGHMNGLKLGLSILENLSLTAKLNNTILPTTTDAILKSLKLPQHAIVQTLSAGQKRRVALARLLLFPKQLWLVDEPFTALDVDTQQFFLTELDKHLQNGGLCVMSSHHAISLSRPIQTLRLGECCE